MRRREGMEASVEMEQESQGYVPEAEGGKTRRAWQLLS